MGADTSPETSEAPITSTAPYFSAPPSRAPPLFHEADTPPPSSRIAEPSPTRGRALGAGGPGDWRSSNPAEDAYIRSSAGPGKVRATWWESSTEEVPSQLLGKRARADAVSSREDPSQDHSLKSSTPAQQPPKSKIHAPPATASKAQETENEDEFDKYKPLFNIGTFEDPPPETSSSESSSPSSAASSFAYQLRRPVDMRLLRKRFKPSQHTKKQKAEKRKASPPLRSPTYGIPKVVEDSRDDTPIGQFNNETYDSLQAFLDKSTKVAVSQLKLPPPKQLRNVSPHTKRERRTDSPSTGRSLSPSSLQPKSAKAKRPGILRSSASLDVTEIPIVRPVRPKATPLSKPSSQESHKSTYSARPRSQKKHHSSSSRTTPGSAQILGPLPATPQSADTGKSETNPFQTDDNYFSTLRTNMTNRQGFTPTLSPTEPDNPPPRPVESPVAQHPVEDEQETWPAMNCEAVQKRQKRGSIFSVFGLPAPNKVTATMSDNVKPASNDLSEAPALVSTWPKVSTDAGKAQWRRMSEDLSIPPYFARSRRRHTNSDVSPSPALSPVSTSNSKGSGSPSSHVRQLHKSSDEIGPICPFTPLPPLREDYDRSRRVSIEIPGTPGIHHRPQDTPAPSSGADTKSSLIMTVVPSTSEDVRPKRSHGSFQRKFSLHPELKAHPHPPSQVQEANPIRKRSSVFQEIASELRGTPNRRKSSSNGERPLRLLQRRRSAIAPVVRQATLTSVASKPVNSPMSRIRELRQSIAQPLVTDPEE